MSTHTKTNIETMSQECADRDCIHASPIGRGQCPTFTWECCKECSDRSWDESEGPVVTWEECGGTGAYWAEIDAERDQENNPCAYRWTCEECGASGPMPDDIFAVPHDCKSRGPFDEVSRLLIEPVAGRPSDSTCPEWQCPDLSSEDRREGRTCPEHPCTCSNERESSYG